LIGKITPEQAAIYKKKELATTPDFHNILESNILQSLANLPLNDRG
jgi:hypothetical protein